MLQTSSSSSRESNIVNVFSLLTQRKSKTNTNTSPSKDRLSFCLSPFLYLAFFQMEDCLPQNKTIDQEMACYEERFFVADDYNHLLSGMVPSVTHQRSFARVNNKNKWKEFCNFKAKLVVFTQCLCAYWCVICHVDFCSSSSTYLSVIDLMVSL